MSPEHLPRRVATQNEELRKRFRGRSEYLVNFFTFLAQEVREYLAEIGVERLDDIIGRTDLIVRKPDDGIRKHQLISFDKLLARVDNEAAIRHVTDQQHGIDHVKDVEMLHAATEAVENQKEISLEYTIANTDRACGAMLSGVIAAKYGEKGLPEHTLNVKFKGSAGQSFGAFLVPGVNFKLEARPTIIWQRSEWRTHRCPASGTEQLRGREKHDCRQHPALWRHKR